VPKTTLGAASLGGLGNGYLGKLIDKALDEIHADIQDRGDEDGAARTLTISLTFKPKHGQVIITPKVTAKVPSLVPPLTVTHPDAALGKLVFNPESAGNPDQKSFDDVLDEAAQAKKNFAARLHEDDDLPAAG